MNVKGLKTESVVVEVSPLDAVNGLINHYGMSRAEWCKGNMLGYSEDISYHGSPTYEYYAKPTTPFELELFHTLEHLRKLVAKAEYHPDECQIHKGGYRKLRYEEYKELCKCEEKKKGLE